MSFLKASRLQSLSTTESSILRKLYFSSFNNYSTVNNTSSGSSNAVAVQKEPVDIPNSQPNLTAPVYQTPVVPDRDAVTQKEWFVGEVSALVARLKLLAPGDESATSPLARKYFPIVARAVAQPDKWNKPVHRLAALGEGYWHAYLVDNLYNRFPALPGALLSSMVQNMRSPENTTKYSKSLGLDIFCKVNSDLAPKLLFSTLMAIQEAKGESSAREFVNRFIEEELAQVRPADSIIIEDPKGFVATCLLEAQMSPLSFKLVKESGRATASPTFVVNAYSGDTLLGTGTAASLSKARNQACRNALTEKFSKESTAYVQAVLNSRIQSTAVPTTFPKEGVAAGDQSQ